MDVTKEFLTMQRNAQDEIFDEEGYKNCSAGVILIFAKNMYPGREGHTTFEGGYFQDEIKGHSDPLHYALLDFLSFL